MKPGDAPMHLATTGADRREVLAGALALLVAGVLRPPGAGQVLDGPPVLNVETRADVEGLVCVLLGDDGRPVRSAPAVLERGALRVVFHPCGSAADVRAIAVEDRRGWRRRRVACHELGAALMVGPGDSLNVQVLTPRLRA